MIIGIIFILRIIKIIMIEYKNNDKDYIENDK